MEPLAEVILSCGRLHLQVAGIVVATEGDRCRHGGFPENLFPPIPQEELESATIGGKKASELPIELVRFFRGDNWNEVLLEFTADAINKKAGNP